MKKLVALLLVAVMLLSLCACGGKQRSPRERLPDEVEEYISTNFRVTSGSYVSEAVNVDVASVVDMGDNRWAVLGTYTIKLGKEIMSAKFGLVAAYNEKSGKFTFSNEEFDNFK